MCPHDSFSRRRVVALAGALGAGSLAGCTGGDDGSVSSGTPTAERRATDTATAESTAATDEGPALVDAIERAAVGVELTADSAGLDSVASRLAESTFVGVGENSHGVAEFKDLSRRLVRRIVADHGYRLIAMEGTLGDFAPVDDYVAGGNTDLDSAMAGLDFYFWRTEAVRGLFEWLREFNADRPAEDRAVVRGYDAQFFDVNARVIRDYLSRVDPAYLDEVDDDLTPLTKPLYDRHDAEFVTDSRTALLESLGERLETHRNEYVAASSASEWQLVCRHVWTLERGLQFQEQLRAEHYTEGKRIRDEAMAENVSWLREWTGADRTVVLGSANHTMRNDGRSGDGAARMGQRLTDEFGDDYYSLGLLFGTGSFAAPTNAERTSFSTYPLGGPASGTLEATLVDVPDSPLFLDFEAASDGGRVDEWLSSTGTVQVSVPRAADRGAVPLPAAPEALYDGVVFVRTVGAASFSTSG